MEEKIKHLGELTYNGISIADLYTKLATDIDNDICVNNRYNTNIIPYYIECIKNNNLNQLLHEFRLNIIPRHITRYREVIEILYFNGISLENMEFILAYILYNFLINPRDYINDMLIEAIIFLLDAHRYNINPAIINSLSEIASVIPYVPCSELHSKVFETITNDRVMAIDYEDVYIPIKFGKRLIKENNDHVKKIDQLENKIKELEQMISHFRYAPPDDYDKIVADFYKLKEMNN